MTYTPTTEEQLVDGYADARCTDPHGNHEGGCTAALKAERLIQQIKEQAWDEGHEDGAWNTHNTLAIEHLIKTRITNPYRSQQ